MIPNAMKILTGTGCLLMVTIAFLVRPLIPIDETRYVTVAWEMWTHGSFMVPLLNGTPYAHKPPLLFWLIHAGWLIFGVNEWWPRLVGPLFTVANLVLLSQIAARLWPENFVVRRLAPLIFVSTWFVAVYLTSVTFDMVLLACILSCWLALQVALQRGVTRGLAIFGVALGLGLLAKGPIAFVYTLPVAFAAPYWCGREKCFSWLRWYGSVTAALGLGLAIPCLWLLAVLYIGESDYLRNLLVGQAVERVAGTLGRSRPFWWYLPLLPLLLLPWIGWVSFWRGARILVSTPFDNGLRFVATGMVGSLAILSMIGSKQAHYLLPVLALAALFMARAIDSVMRPDRRIDRLLVGGIVLPIFLVLTVWARTSTAMTTLWITHFPPWLAAAAFLPLSAIFAIKVIPAREVALAVGGLSLSCAAICVVASGPLLRDEFDLQLLGQYLGEQEEAGRALAIVGIYEGQFGFYGRLRRPITSLDFDGATTWALEHPNGLIITEPGRSSFDAPIVLRQATLDGDWKIYQSGMVRGFPPK